MKLTRGTVLDIELSGSEEGIDCQISTASTEMVFAILSSHIYANPIGSMIREITSNCFDSHIEAGVDDPVVLKYTREENIAFISFVDVGVGLSPERMQKVYSNYLESTKRLGNDQLGMWGLGSKSPLAYQDSFQLITRYDGIEYFYLVHKGEKGLPRIEKMDESETSERNGTEIKVEIKHDGELHRWSTPDDYYRIQDEIMRQLCYFDNVYFDGFSLDNDYSIYEGEHFKFRNRDQYSDELHIVLGKVAYPIDWNTIGYRRIEMPLGIKFEIGELEVTPSRESLKYSEETKQLVRDRIMLVMEEVKGLYLKQLGDWSFGDYLFARKHKTVRKLNIAGYNIRLDGYKKGELETFSIPGFVGTIPEDPFAEFYIGKYIGPLGRIKFETIDAGKAILEHRRCMRLKGDLSHKEKNQYIYDQFGEMYLLERKHLKLKSMMKRLELPIKLGAFQVKEQIEIYRRYVQKYIVEKYESYDRLEIPKQWLIDLKENRKQQYLNSQVRRKINKQILVHHIGYNNTWNKSDWNTNDLNQYLLPKTTLIYGVLDQKKQIKALSGVFEPVGYDNYRNKHNIQFIVTAKSNIDYIKDRPNSYSMEEVLSGKFRTFKKVMTAVAIKDYKTPTIEFMERYMKDLSEPIYQDIQELDKATRYRPGYGVDGEFLKELEVLAQEQNLLDQDLLNKAEKLKNYFADLPLLKFIHPTGDNYRKVYPSNAEFIPAVVEYMKFKKKKLNPNHYFIPTELELSWLVQPSLGLYALEVKDKKK